MSRGMLAERETIAVPGVWLFLVLVLGALLAGCGGSEEEEGDLAVPSSPEEEEGDLSVPSSPEDAGEVVIRVSGTEGIVYSGTYGTIEGTLETVEDTLGSGPTEYAVEVAEGVSDGVTAGFQKIQPGEGELQIEILADDEVVVESRTLVDLGAVNADWFPPVEVPDILPGENAESLPGEEVAPEESP